MPDFASEQSSPLYANSMDAMPLHKNTSATDESDRQELEQAKFFLAAIVESSQDSIVTVDFHGIITTWNHAAERLYGYLASEAIGQRLATLTRLHDLREVLDNIEKVKHHQKVEIFDSVRVNKDGRDMTLEVVMSPVKNAGGEVIGVSTIARDVTDLRIAEASRQETEEHYRLLVEGVPDYAMFLMDAQRRIVHWNQGALRLLGWCLEEAVGQSGDIIFTREDRAAGAPEQEAQIAVDQGACPDIRWHVRKDGSRFWTDGINTSLRHENGELRGFVKIMRDATRDREADDALRRARDELEQRVQERTQDLQEEVLRRRQWEVQRTQLMQRIVRVQEEERGRISRELHDNLGQHTTAILLLLQAMQTEEPHGEERRQGAASLLRLRQEIDEMLNTTHRLAWELRPAVLDNVGLEAALRQYVEQWARHGTVADFASRLPESSTGTPITGLSSEAETALYRVTQEALTNVLRHAEATHVSVVLERSPAFVSVIIEDDGRGFEVEVADAGRLGLRGMQERMQLVGGTLEVESEPGSGTSVYARVPLEATQP